MAEYPLDVVDQRVVSVDHYEGDSKILLDMGAVDSALAAYHGSATAPSAYGIDFGVLATGETTLVEADDGTCWVRTVTTPTNTRS